MIFQILINFSRIIALLDIHDIKIIILWGTKSFNNKCLNDSIYKILKAIILKIIKIIKWNIEKKAKT